MKIFLSTLLSVTLILFSCKKNNSNNTTPSTQGDSSHLNATGLVPSTELEVQNIESVDALDSSLVPNFERLTDLPESTYLDVPDPDSQGQGKYESCAGWAIGYGLLSYEFKHIDGNTDYDGLDKKFSPYYIWNQLNNNINQGISLGAAMNLVLEQGCCRLVDMPSITDETSKPSSVAITNAANYKLTTVWHKFLITDINKMKFFLSKGYPIAVGILVDDAFRIANVYPGETQPDGRKVWKNYSGTARHGHAVLICGYDNSINAFKVLNSWGTGWGDKGYFWIDYDFFKKAVEYVIGGLKPEIYLGTIERPILKTNPIVGIVQNSAQSGGTISSDNGLSITSRGVCWSTTPNPTISANNTNDGTGIGSFVSNLSGLTAKTTYYVKAYATNSAGTSYGTQMTFTTTDQAAPILSTSVVTSITQSSAVSGGNITNDGDSPISARGVCWSTTSNPTTANSKTSDGTGAGSFTSSITGLAENTLYHARAYATNALGTTYGNEVSFTTLQTTGNTVTDIDGNVYHTVTIGTQVWMVENLRATHYRNGNALAPIGDGLTFVFLDTGAYTTYGDPNIYGMLYNWYAATDYRDICPVGWHIPSDAEWTTLTDFLGGESIAGDKMKATSLWYAPATMATNESGFTGLPAGYLDGTNLGERTGYGLKCYWWTSTIGYSFNPWVRGLANDYSGVNRSDAVKYNGFSIRCIKDN